MSSTPDAVGAIRATTELQPSAEIPKKLLRTRILALLGRYGMLAIFLVAVAFLLVDSPEFRDPNNLLNVLQQSSITGIVACGMLVIIISGGFDLSVGSIGAASSCAAAALIVHQSVVLGIVGALGVGLAVGLLNGLLIAKIGMNPFVATLGTGVLVTGILFAQTDANAISGLPLSFSELGLGRLFGIPNPALIFAGVALLTWLLLRYARVGHYVYAVGGNKEAARLAGLPVDRTLVFAYALGGLFAGVGGVVLLGQTNIGQPSAASDWALTAIAAVVVGGTPLRGGIGGVYSAIVGTLLLGVVSNALNLYGVSPYWQPAVTGLVILVAVGLDSYYRKGRGGVS